MWSIRTSTFGLGSLSGKSAAPLPPIGPSSSLTQGLCSTGREMEGLSASPKQEGPEAPGPAQHTAQMQDACFPAAGGWPRDTDSSGAISEQVGGHRKVVVRPNAEK